MNSTARYVRWAGFLAVLALAGVSAGCSGDQGPEPTATEESAAPTPPPEASTPEPTPTPSEGPEPPSAAGGFDIEIDDDTTMQEVFDAFGGSEQECIRDDLGDELLESVLGTRALSEDDLADEAMMIFSCLAPETAREFFLAAFLAGAESEGLITEIGAEEEACLRERLAEIDMAAAMAEIVDSESPPVAISSLFGCVPDLFIEAILADDEAAAELTEQQRSCLRDLIAEADWTVLAEAMEGEPESDAVLEFGFSLFACLVESALPDEEPEPTVVVEAPAPTAVPAETSVAANQLESATPVTVGAVATGEVEHGGDEDYFVFEAEEGELYQIDVALGTLGDSVAVLYDSEGFELASNDDHGDTLASRIYWEADYSGSHYLAVNGYFDGTGTYTLGLALVDATPLAIGWVAPGEVEHEGDVDFFVFEAEEGHLYQINVALGTLGDSVAVLYDSEGFELASNDDHGDTLASRIYWEADYSGSHYVAVNGSSTSTGSYTLGLAAVEDDHSDFLPEATPVAVGETMPGVMTNADDVDYFVFEAEEGELYQIDVALGTLGDSVAVLYDSEGFELASNDDHGDTLASRIYWEADYSGSHYLAVNGY
ncbi:MAG: alanine and proline-rich secreted protein Apa, partial [Acidimicrobiia bacterium]|nr:alanine and proline-rich secreted protein Apa [Acidimicrobiia bacterium]